MASHKWRFFRVGGFDQVAIDTGEDILHLGELDQKLWAVLSCPVKDLEFDKKTLEYLDTDKDGHIRVPEVLEAVTWTGSLIKKPDVLVNESEGIPLDAINDSTEEGKIIFNSARQILQNLGKEREGIITVEDTGNEDRIFSQTRFNGDGIIPALSTDDEDIKAVINDIILCLGAETDRSGNPGISKEMLEKFVYDAKLYSEWHEELFKDPSILVLGGATEDAYTVLLRVRDKIDDFFIRCNLAKFDRRSSELLNPSMEDYQRIAPCDLSSSKEAYASFPIAIVEPGKPLPLIEGLNPAWVEPIKKFRDSVVTPILGEKESITIDEWDKIKAFFIPYETWINKKPETSIEKLGIERVKEVLRGNYGMAIEELIQKDRSFETQANAIASVDKLVRYCKYLHTFINNFVAFRDFYSLKKKAIFQAGTLYLDGRSCELCIKVDDIASHATLSNLSNVYLVYCNCVRRGGTDKMTIVAAFTAGDSDQLMVGRNGVFYDRGGQDWDATVVRILEHPISIRQAFWSPYKQASKMISEQLMKIAAARSKASSERLAVQAMQAGTQAATGKPKEAEKAFDAGKFAGIFAAIGLAIGFIGSAITSILTGLLRLAWWQLPLLFIFIILAISGPSMFIAWIKLRRRNLGPILDANGWAVNTRAKINIKFGTSLTGIAKIPEGSERLLKDPYADKKTPWGLYLLIALIIIAVLILWKVGVLSKLF
ncbi:MAG: hypothetical protein N2745_06595 [Syntrophorhabdaceae bacterium]|nr:hypothetical protein [Syntrophorhabdaceae bacterium]